jgi:hypothetical protein
MVTEYWYRLEEQRYAAPLDEFERPMGRGRLVVHVRKLKVVRHTPKGVWLAGLSWSEARPRFVRKDARRQFACPTLEGAKFSFRKRKERQASIFRARAETADEAVGLMACDRLEFGPDW